VSEASEPQLVRGGVAPEVADEYPELRLWSLVVEAVPRRSPSGVRARLKALSDGFRGPQAVMLRQQPVPWAYRVFFRHIGLDPDADRTPVEALALKRLLRGGFRSEGIVDDALTIAVMETGVPVWALDAEHVEGTLEIRPAVEHERLGRRDQFAPWLPAGRLVVADAVGPVAVLFGDLAPGHGVTRESRRLLLLCVQVAGVPAIHVEEAMWLCTEVLTIE